MSTPTYEPGEVLLLEHEIPGISYETGLFVLRVVTEGAAIVSLVSNDAEGLYGINNSYTISVEDLVAFTPTDRKARVRK